MSTRLLRRYLSQQAVRRSGPIAIGPLEDVVEVTRYVETGEKAGNVVLTVGGVA